MTISNENKKQKYSFWRTFQKHFPWKDFLLGLFIPKMIFYILWHYFEKPLIGGLLAISYCIILLFITFLRTKKLDWFSLIGLGMVTIRMATVITKDHHTLFLIAEMIDNSLFGFIFLGSLFFPRPLIQVFAEAGNVEISKEIRISPYYRKAWQIITAVWGIVNIIESIILLIFELQNSPAVGTLDIFSGWPTTVLLFSFSIYFPGWYWKKNWKKIKKEKASPQ